MNQKDHLSLQTTSTKHRSLPMKTSISNTIFSNSLIAILLASMVLSVPARYAQATDANLAQIVYPGDAIPAGEIMVGTPVVADLPVSTVGHIAAPGDSNLYSFSAQAGQTYVIETHLGSLNDTILGLDTGTQTIEDDDGGEGLASRITWTASSTQLAVFWVMAYSQSATGRYAVSVQTSGFFGAALQSPALQGEITTGGDAGWHAIRAQAGSKITLAVGLGSLADSTLTLYGQDASTVLASNDDLLSVPADSSGIFGSSFQLSSLASGLEVHMSCKDYAGNDNYAGLCDATNPANAEIKTIYAQVAGYSATQTGSYAIWVQDHSRLPHDAAGLFILGGAVVLIILLWTNGC